MTTTETVQADRKTISVDEAAAILGISRNSAYEAVRRGEIPAIRIGKLFRIPVTAFEKLMTGAR